MAQHAMETGEQSARKAGSSALAESKVAGAPDKIPEGASAASAGDVDESKFSSLTASLLVRKRSAAAASSGGATRKSGGEVGFRVLGFDIDAAKVQALNAGRRTIHRRNQPNGIHCSRTGGACKSSSFSASSLRHCASNAPEGSSSSAGCDASHNAV